MREERKLQKFENKVARRMHESERDEVKWGVDDTTWWASWFVLLAYHC